MFVFVFRGLIVLIAVRMSEPNARAIKALFFDRLNTKLGGSRYCFAKVAQVSSAFLSMASTLASLLRCDPGTNAGNAII
ncbi:MAG: hypothetical protein BYD32DRAFT_423275 [Podila humilis]|nr:MAG: hypothetical protein BYD32DRAFT_423275 [Podila humilis]